MNVDVRHSKGAPVISTRASGKSWMDSIYKGIGSVDIVGARQAAMLWMAMRSADRLSYSRSPSAAAGMSVVSSWVLLQAWTRQQRRPRGVGKRDVSCFGSQPDVAQQWMAVASKPIISDGGSGARADERSDAKPGALVVPRASMKSSRYLLQSRVSASTSSQWQQEDCLTDSLGRGLGGLESEGNIEGERSGRLDLGDFSQLLSVRQGGDRLQYCECVRERPWWIWRAERH